MTAAFFCELANASAMTCADISCVCARIFARFSACAFACVSAALICDSVMAEISWRVMLGSGPFDVVPGAADSPKA